MTDNFRLLTIIVGLNILTNAKLIASSSEGDKKHESTILIYANL